MYVDTNLDTSGMAVDDEKTTPAPAERVPETHDKNIENGSTDGSEAKKDAMAGYIPQSDDDYVLTW